MGFIGSMLGAGQGTGFQAAAPDPNSIANAGAATNASLAQQQAFTNALQPQTLGAVGAQNQLLGQLQQQSVGGGPNPAQAALAQNTAANVANQASLAAGQRGASSNAGLIARQAAQQGAATQQQAVGQAATMGAQQQLAAQGQLASLAGTQIGQAGAATNAQTGAQQTTQGQLLQAQSSANQANEGSAVQNSKAQQGIFGGLLGGAGSLLAEGGMVGDDSDGGNPVTSLLSNFSQGGQADFSGKSGAPSSAAGKFLMGFNSSNQQMAQPDNSNPVQAGTGQFSSKLFGQLKSALAGKAPATGPSGQVNALGGEKFGPDASLAGNDSIGGMDSTNELNATQFGPDAIESGGTLDGGDIGAEQMGPDAINAGGDLGAGADAAEAGEAAEGADAASSADSLAALFASGGGVNAMVSPGEKYIPPQKVNAVASGKVNPMAAGKTVPGKPKVKGNSIKNDVVPAKLETGGVVIPNSIMQSKDAAAKAQKFVEAILAKQSLKRAK